MSICLKTGQKLIIEILAQVNGEASRISLMKWLFLVLQETEWGRASSPYSFVPCNYGPFSFLAYRDIRSLTESALLTQNGALIELCTRVISDLRPEPLSAVHEIMERYGSYTTEELLRYTYAQYPWYALNSVREDLVGQRRSHPQAADGIYTIGYEGSSIDAFLNALLLRGLKGVVDVRAVPRSRVFGFHAKTLCKCLSDVGLQYLPRPELGIPAADRQEIGAAEDRRGLLSAYQQRIQACHMEQVEELAEVMVERPLALMCMEADPARCHRSVLAGIVEEVCGLGVEHVCVGDVPWKG